MLKTTVVTNTWKCDGCGFEEVAVDNPFIHFELSLSTPGAPKLEFDLHQDCLDTLRVQGSTPITALVDYLSENAVIIPG